MSVKSGFIWIVLLISISSCVSYEKLSIEVFKPAKFTLPADMHKVVLVSRNLKYETDTLQNYQVKNQRLIKDKIKFNSDSLAIKICLDSLAGQLLTHSRFDSILVLPVNSFPEIRTKEIRPDKADWYKNVSSQADADGLILLDMFSCFYSDYENNNPTPFANVITSNIWSIYDAGQHKIINRYAQIDTLFWDGTDDAGHYKKIRIPEKKAAIAIAAGVIGKNYSKYLIPAWTTVYRDIMTCKQPELSMAAKLAQKNKWEEASAIWQKYIESKSKQNKIVALYNLALTNEMNGNIDQAIEYTDRAAKMSSGAFLADENRAIRKYSAVLYQRKIEINKLDAQNELL